MFWRNRKVSMGFVAAGVVGLCGGSAVAEPFLASMSFGADEDPSTFFELDAQAPSLTFSPRIFSPTFQVDGVTEPVTGVGGLEYSGGSSPTLYASLQFSDGPFENPTRNGGILRVDPVTGQSTFLGRVPIVNNIVDLAWNPVTNDLYGITNQGDVWANVDDPLNARPLGQIDRPSSDDNPFEDRDINDVRGMAFDSQGNLHVFEANPDVGGIFVAEAAALESTDLQSIEVQLLDRLPYNAYGFGGLFIDWSRDDAGYLVGVDEPDPLNGFLVPRARMLYFDPLSLGGSEIDPGQYFIGNPGFAIDAITRAPVPAPGALSVCAIGGVFAARRRRRGGSSAGCMQPNRLVVVSVGAVAIAATASAVPITMTWQFEASGAVDGVRFERTDVTLTVTSDNDEVHRTDNYSYIVDIIRNAEHTMTIDGVGVFGEGLGINVEYTLATRRIGLGLGQTFLRGPEDPVSFEGWNYDRGLEVSGWGLIGRNKFFAGGYVDPETGETLPRTPLYPDRSVDFDRAYTWTTFTFAVNGETRQPSAVPAPGGIAAVAVAGCAALRRRHRA